MNAGFSSVLNLTLGDVEAQLGATEAQLRTMDMVSHEGALSPQLQRTQSPRLERGSCLWRQLGTRSWAAAGASNPCLPRAQRLLRAGSLAFAPCRLFP